MKGWSKLLLRVLSGSRKSSEKVGAGDTALFFGSGRLSAFADARLSVGIGQQYIGYLPLSTKSI